MKRTDDEITETNPSWLVLLPDALGDAICSTVGLNVILERCQGVRDVYVGGPHNLAELFDDIAGAKGFLTYESLLNNTAALKTFEWVLDFSSTNLSRNVAGSLRWSNSIYRDPTDGRMIHIEREGNSKQILPCPIFDPGLQGRAGNPEEPAWALEAPLAAVVLEEDFWAWIEHGLQPSLKFRTNPEAIVNPTEFDGVVFLAPCGSAQAKRWPEENWLALAEGLQAAGERPVIVLGPYENYSCQILGKLSCLRAYRDLSLRELAAAFAMGKLVIANDSGPMHLAAAQGLPTVGIFGPTNPRCWFCYHGHNQIYCQSEEAYSKIDPWGVILEPNGHWDLWIGVQEVLALIGGILDRLCME